MYRKLRMIMLAFAVMATVNIKAEVYDEDEWYRAEAMVTWEINTDFHMGYYFGAMWTPVKYVGIGASLGVATDKISFGDDSNFDDAYSGDVVRWVCKPTLHLRTPRIFSLGPEVGFHLFLSPEMIFASRSRRFVGSDWKYWSGAAGIMLSCDRTTVSLGYRLTNFSIFDGRYLTESGEYKEGKDYTHSIFLTVGYKFWD